VTRWFHRTCSHSVWQIEDEGVVNPHRQAFLGVSLSWWAFDRTAPALALGLASHNLVKCDRMEYQFAAVPEDAHLIVPWSAVSRQFQMGTYLEATRGTRPTLWGVAFEPVRAVLM